METTPVINSIDEVPESHPIQESTPVHEVAPVKEGSSEVFL